MTMFQERRHWGNGRSKMGISAALAAVLAVIVMIVIFAVGTIYVAPALEVAHTTHTSTTTSQGYALAAATVGYDHFNPGTSYTGGRTSTPCGMRTSTEHTRR